MVDFNRHPARFLCVLGIVFMLVHGFGCDDDTGYSNANVTSNMSVDSNGSSTSGNQDAGVADSSGEEDTAPNVQDDASIDVQSDTSVSEDTTAADTSSGACIQVTPPAVTFGPASVGSVREVQITISNCSGTALLEVLDVSIDSLPTDSFSLPSISFPFEAPLRIPPGSRFEFLLHFAPTQSGVFSGSLIVETTDLSSPQIVLPVSGEGTDSITCPMAIGGARVAGSDLPLSTNLEAFVGDTIEFDGLESTHPNSPNDPNSIARYEWRVVERPPDATGSFVPNPAVPRPNLFFDVPGLYVVEFRVFDTFDTPSCNVVTLRLTALPASDILVLLTWDTPADPNQNDSGIGRGADMDLHFLNPMGTWNSRPWDCYWENASPNWGEVEDASDDPQIERDDSDGLGPESISLNNPEDVGYRIGIYYYNDHDFGTSFATVRVFVHQQLVFEARDKEMERDQFWEVGRLTWPSMEVESIDTLQNGFP